MGTHQIPVLVQALFCHFPEQIRIADSRENVVGLHPVISVIGAELKKLRQILMPHIQVHGRGALAHPQLVNGHSRIIDKLDPADHSPCRALKSAYAASRCPDLSKIQAHAATELAHLGKVVHTSVNTFQTVGHCVYKAAGQLVIWFSCIGKGWRGHGDLHQAQHIVKPAHPFHAPVPVLLHGQMERNAQIHFLGCLQGVTAVVLDHIAF